MRRVLLIAAALALASSRAWAADLATPTLTAVGITPAATPAEQPALTLHASARGTCTFNLPSLAAAPTPAPTPATSFGLTPTIAKITCPAPGANVNDLVLVGGFMPYDTGGTTAYSALTLRGCVVRTQGVLDCILAYGGNAALDPGPLSFAFVALP